MKTSPYITFFTKDYNRRHDPWKIPYDVPAAFPVLDGSPSETAKYWAGEGYKEYRYQNTFDDVRILDLDRRSQGGRAYKIIIKVEDGHEFICDLREDTLLDVIKNSSIERGGYLLGNFSWVMVGSQCTLVRIGSDIWNEAQKQNVAKAAKKIPNASLKFGHLYMTAGGDLAIFIAKVYQKTYQVDLNRSSLIPSESTISSLLFCNVNNKEDAQNVNDSILSGAKTYLWNFKNNHSFRIDQGKVLDDSLTPEIVLQYFRNLRTNNLSEKISELNKRRNGPPRSRSVYESDLWYLTTYAKEASTALSLDELSSTPIALFDQKL